jgi:hypothetical protein
VANNENLGQVSAKKWHVHLYDCEKEKRIITTQKIHLPSGCPSGFQNQIIVKLILATELQNLTCGCVGFAKEKDQ